MSLINDAMSNALQKIREGNTKIESATGFVGRLLSGSETEDVADHDGNMVPSLKKTIKQAADDTAAAMTTRLDAVVDTDGVMKSGIVPKTALSPALSAELFPNPWTPTAGNEYPVVAGLTSNRAYTIQFTPITNTYKFLTGALKDKTAAISDKIVWNHNTNVWSLVKAGDAMNPDTTQAVSQPRQRGDGTKKVFDTPATTHVVAPETLWVYFDGVKQRTPEDYGVTEAGKINFTTPPKRNVAIDITWFETFLFNIDSVGSAMVTPEGGVQEPLRKAIVTEAKKAANAVEDVYVTPTGGVGGLLKNILGKLRAPIATGSTTARTLEDRFADVVNVKDFGILPDGQDHTAKWLNLVDVIQPARIYIPEGTYNLQIFKVKANSEVFGDGMNRTKINLTNTGKYTVVMGQINGNSHVHDLAINSLMPDLEWQRCSLENSSNVTLERISFSGFLNPTKKNSWGLYLKNSSHIHVLQCRFNNNTQSDIAITDQVKNVSIDNCYAETSAFHINFEPNASTSGNQGITVTGSKLSQLSLLENGSGGTATTQATITGCEIEKLVYDGTSVSLIDCKVNIFESQSNPFMGSLGLVNTIGLEPNLLEDPYFCNFGFNKAQAEADNNGWFMRGRTGSVGANQLDAGVENGLRYTRVNPTKADGLVYFSPQESTPVIAGETYCLVLTGRRVEGTSGRYVSVETASMGQVDYRVFRHSNLNSNPWGTELIFISPTTSEDLQLKIGTFAGGESFDLSAISLHKVNRFGTNARRVIDSIHEVGGTRIINARGEVTARSTDLLSLQAGDVIKSGDKAWVWGTTAGRSIY
ncbi:hypothetical protein VPHK469_0160 [Vibrio phage K469]